MKAAATTLGIYILWAGPALAQACPPAPDHEAQIADLIAKVQAAPDLEASRLLSSQFWAVWKVAPDAQAQALLDRGLERMRRFDFDRAAADFDALIRYCPQYAEGYNQRGFFKFIRQDYAGALADLDLALARDPDHIAAMSGKAQALLRLGRDREGQRLLRETLALNPWLTDLLMLKDDAADPL